MADPAPRKTPRPHGVAVETARRLRRAETVPERLLWDRIRRPHMLPFVFRRQHPIEAFFVDFYCASARLVIEVDGPVHETQADDDRQRQEYLESLGLRVLRFSNADVFTRLDAVVDEIRQVCSNPKLVSGAER